MKSFYIISLAGAMIFTSVVVSGCSSGVQTVSPTPTNSGAAKQGFNNVVKDNPNIPDSAKKAMIGTPNPGK